ncbi:MAG: endonuclease III [Candidatus Eremiobacter antarcticus]|nr:endonuclease III [Candidatus Eremiobacteraeota bacterium]MBC5807018.1 endonuclease III [Candidatus Eremiobacteraeota bacterium]PZR62850.1 MAG: endonuclease III [Candidatus Eremiobacter sp. RRmetagenome_bin22]
MASVARDQRRRAVLSRLASVYAGATTALRYRNDFELLIAVILSAQCTDARVNLVTPALFRAYPNAAALARPEPKDVEPYIKTCGLYRSKAKNIVAASRKIAELGGRIPDTMEDLLELPGVGRKTANVVLAVAYERDAIAVDTHVFRVANRLRLVRAKTPEKAEHQLMKVVPRAQWSQAHHWLIHHGREICHARIPECPRCPLLDLCPSAKYFLRARAQRASRAPKAKVRRPPP